MSKVDRKKIESYCVYIGLFLTYLFLMLANINRYSGFTDENDNFLGGMVLANGGSMYVDFISQHMPFMYYLCAIFKLLGANSSFMFRLYFYIFMAMCWVVMYKRYSKSFGKSIMCVYPILYIINMNTLYTSCVLSDQMQALGMVILFLEFLNYYKNRKIEIDNCIAISIAIVFSFGSAFVSIYAIFIIAVAVVLCEIKECYDKKLNIIKSLKHLINKYWKMLLIISFPFVILICIYLLKGTLYDFYFGAFKVNTSIYSKYIGGYGANPLRSFLTPIDSYFNTLSTAIDGLISKPMDNIRIIICLLINVLFVIKVFLKNKKLSIALFAFTLMCGTRGFGFEFHALPYYGITTIMAAILIDEYIFKTANNQITKRFVLAVILFLVFSAPYFSQFSSIFNTKYSLTYKKTEDSNQYEYYISKLTNKSDRILLCNINPALLVNSNRLPVPTGASVPWMYEGYKQNDSYYLGLYNPKVVIFNKDYEVWGYKIIDYAPELVSYIEDQYVNLGVASATDIYVRKDYFIEASSILGINNSSLVVDTASTITNNIGGIREQSVSQIIKIDADKICKVGTLFGTYQRTNQSKLSVTITEVESNNIIWNGYYKVSELLDNTVNYIEFDSVKVKRGAYYKVDYKAEDTTDNDFITIYYNESLDNDVQQCTLIDNKEQSYNLCLQLYSPIE